MTTDLVCLVNFLNPGGKKIPKMSLILAHSPSPTTRKKLNFLNENRFLQLLKSKDFHMKVHMKYLC